LTFTVAGYHSPTGAYPNNDLPVILNFDPNPKRWSSDDRRKIVEVYRTLTFLDHVHEQSDNDILEFAEIAHKVKASHWQFMTFHSSLSTLGRS